MIKERIVKADKEEKKRKADDKIVMMKIVKHNDKKRIKEYNEEDIKKTV